MDRRKFLQAAMATMGGAGVLSPRLWAFDPVAVENPLGAYPNRNWEALYRDQYRYDRSFTWVCAERYAQLSDDRIRA